MRNLLIVFILALTLFGCEGKNDNIAKIDGIEIDSIKADSTLLLTAEPNSPKCDISISLQYIKGKKAEKINQSLIRSGIFVPDYFSLTDESIDIKTAVDSFIRRCMTEYRSFYTPLYRADRENAPTYNCSFQLRTKTQSHRKKILTYIADLSMYHGGAHIVKQTLAKNFDTESGKVLTLPDLFIDGYESSMKELIIRKLAEKYQVKDLKSLKQLGIFTDENIYIPDNFILDRSKITFIYCESEIAPYEMGEIRVDIDNDEMDSFLK